MISQKTTETKRRNVAETSRQFVHTSRAALANHFTRARHTAPVGSTHLSAQADRFIKLSKIDTASRWPLGARLESTRPRKVRGAPSLIPESHRNRRESMSCCRVAVALLSSCCHFSLSPFDSGAYRTGYGRQFKAIEGFAST